MLNKIRETYRSLFPQKAITARGLSVPTSVSVPSGGMAFIAELGKGQESYQYTLVNKTARDLVLVLQADYRELSMTISEKENRETA